MQKSRPKENPLIVALDTPSFDTAREWISQTRDHCKIYKVGLELFTATGPKILDHLTNQDLQIFLDLKLHDIPNTVGKTVRHFGNYAIRFASVHTMGGHEMMQAAQENCPVGLDLLGVTILTHHDQASIKAIGMEPSLTEQVMHLAMLAASSGLSGVVSSAHEARAIKTAIAGKLTTVCPGIRPQSTENQDQKRVATPKWALENGADYIVVGRPITDAVDVAEAARQIALPVFPA